MSSVGVGWLLSASGQGSVGTFPMVNYMDSAHGSVRLGHSGAKRCVVQLHRGLIYRPNSGRVTMEDNREGTELRGIIVPGLNSSSSLLAFRMSGFKEHGDETIPPARPQTCSDRGVGWGGVEVGVRLAGVEQKRVYLLGTD